MAEEHASGSGESVPGPCPPPVQELDSLTLLELAVERVWEALSQLPPEQRQALLAYRLEGVPTHDLAVRLALGDAKVEREMCAALAHLRKALFTRGEDLCRQGCSTTL